MIKNYVSIIRYPLVTNVHAPLRLELPDEITLGKAISEARNYAKKKGYEIPSHLHWNGAIYRFMDSGVFLMDKNNRPLKKMG